MPACLVSRLFSFAAFLALLDSGYDTKVKRLGTRQSGSDQFYEEFMNSRFMPPQLSLVSDIADYFHVFADQILDLCLIDRDTIVNGPSCSSNDLS